jgi:hypothetical protein
MAGRGVVMSEFEWVYSLDEIAGEAYAEWVRSEFQAGLSSASLRILTEPMFRTLFELLVNRYRHDRYNREGEYVAWALSALESGLDTPNLCILAGLTEPLTDWEVERYFWRTLTDLKIDLPDELPSDDVLRWRLMCQTAHNVVTGAVLPRQGCTEIYNLSATFSGSGIEELDWWGLLDDGCWESLDLSNATDWDSAIVEAAKSLLASSFCAGAR